MIIGLNGRLQSGKDTTYSIIRELHPHAERISFAAKLKQSAAAVLNMDVNTMEWLKNREDLFYTIDGSHAFNMRQFLQRYGTEGHRDIFGQDFWVDMALPLNLDHENRLIVVTDMRFPNEIQRVKDLDGICVKIERDTVTQHGDHPSEQDVDQYMDMILDNTGTMDDLRESVAGMLSIIELQYGSISSTKVGV